MKRGLFRECGRYERGSGDDGDCIDNYRIIPRERSMYWSPCERYILWKQYDLLSRECLDGDEPHRSICSNGHYFT